MSKFVTDRQADKFFDTIYGCVWNFSSSLICYLPTCFARRGITNSTLKTLETVMSLHQTFELALFLIGNPLENAYVHKGLFLALFLIVLKTCQIKTRLFVC